MERKSLCNKNVWLALSRYFATVQRLETPVEFTKLLTARNEKKYKKYWHICNIALLKSYKKLPIKVYESFLLLKEPKDLKVSIFPFSAKNSILLTESDEDESYMESESDGGEESESDDMESGSDNLTNTNVTL